MTKTASSSFVIDDTLPVVKDALRQEIAERIAAGESIARVDGDLILSSQKPARDLRTRRNALLEGYEKACDIGDTFALKSVA